MKKKGNHKIAVTEHHAVLNKKIAKKRLGVKLVTHTMFSVRSKYKEAIK